MILLFELGNNESMQLLSKNTTYSLCIDSINKNVCCGHYIKSVVDITFLERFISSHIYYGFLFCWVFYMFSKNIIKLNINKSSL